PTDEAEVVNSLTIGAGRSVTRARAPRGVREVGHNRAPETGDALGAGRRSTALGGAAPARDRRGTGAGPARDRRGTGAGPELARLSRRPGAADARGRRFR